MLHNRRTSASLYMCKAYSAYARMRIMRVIARVRARLLCLIQGNKSSGIGGSMQWP